MQETMRVPGQLWEITLSLFIACSCDMELPDDFEIPKAPFDFGSYRYMEFYDALQWVCKIRDLLRLVEGQAKKQSESELATKTRWATKFLLEPNEVLYRRLCDGLSRQFKVEKSILAQLSYLGKLATEVSHPESPSGGLSPFVKKVQSVVRQFLDDYRLEWPDTYAAIFKSRPLPKAGAPKSRKLTGQKKMKEVANA